LQVAPGSVPLTFPTRWLALPAIREAMAQAIGTPYPVHASQSFLYGANIETDRNYDLRIAIHQASAPSPRVTVQGTLRDHDDKIVLNIETVLYPTNVISAATRPNRFRNGGSALPEIQIGPVDMPQAARYAAVAHDDNRLHCDPEFARSLGLDGPILPGMMMMGMFQKALSEWRMSGPVSRLFALFVRPVPIGSQLAIGGWILLPNPKAQERQIVRFFVRTERDPVVCIGEASLGPDPSSSGLPAAQ